MYIYLFNVILYHAGMTFLNILESNMTHTAPHMLLVFEYDLK